MSLWARKWRIGLPRLWCPRGARSEVAEGTDEGDINSLLTKSFSGAELVKLGLSTVLGNRKPEQDSQETPPADKSAAWNESQAGKCTERAIQQLVTRLMEKIPLAAENDIEDMKVSALQFQGLGSYSEATEITVRGSAKALKAIVGSLLADESLKPFNLRVASATQEGVVFKKS